jgi:hypothetical protein
MKKGILAVCTLALSFGAVAQIKKVWAPVDHLYVPKGFDNNDSVEVVVSGFFPTPCYSHNKVEVDTKKNIVKIRMTALLSDDHFKWCPEMVVPYFETVSVGNLKAGEYKVVVNSENKNFLKGKIGVDEATSSAIDEHVYAFVEGIERVGSTNEFILKAVEHSDCLALDRIDAFDNGQDVVSILPIMKRVKFGCNPQEKKVEYRTQIDFTNMKGDKALVHVRTMTGKSVNGLVDLGGDR